MLVVKVVCRWPPSAPLASVISTVDGCASRMVAKKKEAYETIIENRQHQHPAQPLWPDRHRLLRGLRLRGALRAEHGSDRGTHSE